MTTAQITITARELKAGDVLQYGGKVLSATIEIIKGYNVERVNVVNEEHHFPVVGWSLDPETKLQVTRAI